MKTILIRNTSGTEVRAQVSDKATVTFGGLIPGAKVDGGNNRTVLRVYEGKMQLAVFTGVESFRFIDHVSILEKRTQTAQKNIVAEEGGFQRVKTMTVQTEEWINPDSVKPVAENAGAVFNQLMIEAK